MAPLITRLNRRHEKSWFRPVRPEIERRLKEYEGLERHRGSQWTQTPNDFLNWSTEQGKETRDPGMCAYKNLVARLLLVKVVPRRVGQGIRTVLAEDGWQWDKRALAQMHELDSVFHESQRLNSVLTVGPLGIVNAKNVVTTLSGVFTPKGYQGGIPAFENYVDLVIWGPDAQEFRPFRFTEKILGLGGDHVQRARHSPVTATPDLLPG